MSDVRDLIIVGGGPAGYTAALYAARANLNPLVIEGITFGGQLMITSDVENYPGYPEGVLGPAMMQDFRRQAERFGAEFITDDVTAVDFSERPFRIEVGSDEYVARAVIVATGASARQIGLESERMLQGRGVSYCAVCDAAFFRSKNVVVVGGGDSAMEEAIFLTKFADKVTVVHRRDEFRASPIMLDRARANPRIDWVTNAVVDEVLGEEGKVRAVRVENVNTGEKTELPTDGLFVAIGHDPNTKLFLDQLDHDEAGYLEVQPGSTETNIKGVFAAGDVADHTYRQAVTAAGTGAMAALDAERLLVVRRGGALSDGSARRSGLAEAGTTLAGSRGAPGPICSTPTRVSCATTFRTSCTPTPGPSCCGRPIPTAAACARASRATATTSSASCSQQSRCPRRTSSITRRSTSSSAGSGSSRSARHRESGRRSTRPTSATPAMRSSTSTRLG